MGIALLMLLGSVYAFLVSLVWPARPALERKPGFVGRRSMLGYEVLLGLAGSFAAAVGVLLHPDHVDWLLGVALGVLFGLAVPALLARRNPSTAQRSAAGP